MPENINKKVNYNHIFTCSPMMGNQFYKEVDGQLFVNTDITYSYIKADSKVSQRIYLCEDELQLRTRMFVTQIS